ncbi:MAG: hypothetical protein CL932_16950 [Deltaproteobacteria bacterium]|nr:hypothetical protein [Deltaproteobacteria bacterium]
MHDGLWFRIRSILEFLFLFGFLTLIGSLFVSFSVLLGKYELITLAFVLLAASSLRVLLSEEKQERLKELPLVGGAVKLYDKLELHYKTQPPTFFLYYLFFPITGPVGFLFSRNARKELAVYASLIQWMLLLLLAEGVASYYRLYRHFDAGFVMDWFYLELLIIYFLCNFFTIPVATSSMRLRLSGRNKQLFAVTTMSCLVLGVLTAYYTMDERYRNLIPINVILDKRISKLKEREAYKRAHVPIPSALKKYTFFPRFERATQIFMHHHGPGMLRFFRKHYFDKGTDKQEEYLEYINGAYQRQLAPLMPLGESEQFFLTTTQGRQHFWGVIMVPFRESVFYFFRYNGLRLRLYKRWVDISMKDRLDLLQRWNQDAYLFSNGKRLAQLIVERMRGIATYLEEKRKLRAKRRKEAQRRSENRQLAPGSGKIPRPTRLSSSAEKAKRSSQGANDVQRSERFRYRAGGGTAPKRRAMRRFRRVGKKKRYAPQESPAYGNRGKMSKSDDAVRQKKMMPSPPRLPTVPRATAPSAAFKNAAPRPSKDVKKMARPALRPPMKLAKPSVKMAKPSMNKPSVIKPSSKKQVPQLREDKEKKKIRRMFTLYHYRLFEFDFKRAMTMRLLYDHFGATPELKKTWWTVLYEWIISLMFNLFYLAMPVHMVVIGVSFLRERSLAKKEAEDDEVTDESDREDYVPTESSPKDVPNPGRKDEAGDALKDRVQARGTVEFGVQHVTFSDVVSEGDGQGKTTPFGVDTSSLQEEVSDVDGGATIEHSKARTDWILRLFVGYILLSIPMLTLSALSLLDHHYRWLRTVFQGWMELFIVFTIWIQPMVLLERHSFWLGIFQVVSVCLFVVGLFALWRRKAWRYLYWQCILCIWLICTFVNVYMIRHHTSLTVVFFSLGFVMTSWMLWRFQVLKQRM